MINLNFLIYKLYRPTESESWEERWDLFLDVSQVDDLGLGTTEQYRRLFKPWILSTWYSRKLSWKPGFVAVQLWEKHLSVSELHTCLAELWYKTTARKGPNVAGSSVAEKSPVNAGDTGSIPCLGRFHMLQSYWACMPQLLKFVCPRARALQQDKPLYTQLESNSQLP